MSDLAQDRFEETVDAAAAEPAPGLPFTFARRFGVVVTDADLGPGRLELVSKGQPSLTTLAGSQAAHAPAAFAAHRR